MKKFKWYCKIFNFNNYDLEFHLLGNFDKLKSMFIVSLYNNKSNIVLFDNSYSFDVLEYVEFILNVFNKFNLCSNKIFIEIKKQVIN